MLETVWTLREHVGAVVKLEKSTRDPWTQECFRVWKHQCNFVLKVAIDGRYVHGHFVLGLWKECMTIERIVAVSIDAELVLMRDIKSRLRAARVSVDADVSEYDDRTLGLLNRHGFKAMRGDDGKYCRDGEYLLRYGVKVPIRDANDLVTYRERL